MKIVIELSEEDYNNIDDCILGVYGDAIKNGVLLPKGHGKLIDADVLNRDLENAQANLGDALSEAFDDGLIWASEVVNKSQAVIEADKKDINPYEKCKTCGQNRESCCGCPEVLELEQKKRRQVNDKKRV